jgi:hypothetical protein
LSQYLGHGRLWSTALNRVSYAVLIGGVLGLLSAVWMVSSETWRGRIVRIAGNVAANPGRAWTSATIVVAAFIGGAIARS